MKINFPFIQIAGILNIEEAKMLTSFENIHLGFPLILDYHKEDLPKENVREIINSLNIANRSVLITYLNKADEIKNLLNYLRIEKVQIHSDIELSELSKLKSYGITIIKSLIVKNNLIELIEQINLQEKFVDAFITDTFDEQTGAKGATGKTHDWNISKKIVELSPKPVILAGGLNSENLLSAIQLICPFGVDAHTGVEDSSGLKSFEKVKKFYDISMKYLKLR